MTQVSNILRAATRKPEEPLNILSFLFDGVFDDYLASTGHNIYGAKESYVNMVYDTIKIKYLPHKIEDVPKDILFDLVIYNNIDLQRSKALLISSLYHIPLLGIQHYSHHSKTTFNFPDDMVFVDEGIKESFSAHGDVIHYGFDLPSIEIKSDKEIDILVYGNILPRDYRIINFIKGLQFRVEVYGDNPGISYDISIDELKEKMSKTKIYLNLATHNGVSYEAILAMLSGCVIVTTQNFMSEYLFKESFSTKVSSIEEIPSVINEVLNKDWEKMGINAKEYALQKYSIKNNLELWKNRLEKQANRIYVR